MFLIGIRYSVFGIRHLVRNSVLLGIRYSVFDIPFGIRYSVLGTWYSVINSLRNALNVGKYDTVGSAESGESGVGSYLHSENSARALVGRAQLTRIEKQKRIVHSTTKVFLQIT